MHSSVIIPRFEQDGTVKIQHRGQFHAREPISEQSKFEQICDDIIIDDKLPAAQSGKQLRPQNWQCVSEGHI